MSPQAGSEPSPEEVFAFFTEQLWHLSLLFWVGWPAGLVCFAGGLIMVFAFKTLVIGAFLFVVSVAALGYLVHSALEQRRQWTDYIEASKAQIERDFRRPDSTLCLVQHSGLGLRDRLLLAKRTDLHFKGYFMSPPKARRSAGVSGIGYVESAKILSGTLPLSRIQGFQFRRSIRLRYLFLASAGGGGGAAFLCSLLAGVRPGHTALISAIVLFAIGVTSVVLLLVHRLPQMVIRTQEYDLHLLAKRPDPDTVIHFLRRLGYRETRKDLGERQTHKPRKTSPTEDE